MNELSAGWAALLAAGYTLAVVRLTGLIVLDRITEPLRDRALVWLDGRGAAGAFLAEGMQCPWCAGMWVSLAAAPLIWWQGLSPVMLVPACVLALSQLAGMMAGIGRGD